MSAAEPANPAPPVVNAGGRGAVIDITKHRRRGGALQSAQGRWTMDTPPEPAEQTPGQASLKAWAEDIEKTFNASSQTLTDDDTANAFVLTLRICARALEGSHATGLITRGQLDEMLAVIRGMEQAPGLV